MFESEMMKRITCTLGYKAKSSDLSNEINDTFEKTSIVSVLKRS